jgi:hypothetical protein
MSKKYWLNIKKKEILKKKKQKEFKRVNKIFHSSYFGNHQNIKVMREVV